MSDATIAYYERGETHHATGRIIDRQPGGRIVIETDDCQRLVGLRVPDQPAKAATS